MIDRPNSEEAIFHAALDLAPEERGDYLASVCRDDQALRGRLQALLQAGVEADSFFVQGALQAALGEVPEGLAGGILPVEEKPGTIIGRFKLLEKIGEGGFGEVWMAEQRAPVKRRVALKIIKLGMDTRQVVARFEAERQALAMMDHPNIAKVFDAGATETGRPYFAMELVHGVRLTEYCDEHRLPTRERLKLFVQVCRAIQHAHQKGVIHRDIKPSNILVTLHDGVPVPKVIDFGIAKATQLELTEKTVFTQFRQFLGTPAYVSPEQVEMSGLDIDTRSDIYSLGVLLYELLTGKTPFDAKELLAAGLDEMRRTIRDKVPVKPSTRLTQAFVGADAARMRNAEGGTGNAESPHADRRTQDSALRIPNSAIPDASSRRLLHEVRGDLDWIVMKCLEKDRTRRYEAANELARDIERHLNHEPVAARPPSQAYRFQTFVRRNKVTVVAATAVATTLLLGLLGSVWEAIRARSAEHRAVESTAQARQNLYAADMSLAQRAIEEDDFARARAFLDRNRPAPGESDLRGFEWRRLWQICQNDEATALEPTVTPPRSVCVSSDGRLIAASEETEGPAMIWDAQSKRLLKTLAKGDRALAFAPNGPTLVTGGGGGLKVWNTLTWSPQYLSPCHVNAAARFSGDGRWLVVQGRGLQVWDTRTWTLVGSNAVSEVNGWNLALLACSRDGSMVACGSGVPPDGAGQVHFFRLPKLEPLPFGQGLPRTLGCLTFTPDDRQIVAGDCGGAIHVYELATRKELSSRMAAPAQINALAFCPTDPNLLATAGTDRTVRLWDFTAQKLRVALHHPTYMFRELAFSPDGTWIAVGGWGNPILIFPTEARKPNDLAVRTSRVLRPLGFSAVSRQLLTLNQDGEVAWWEVESRVLSLTRRLTVPVADAFVLSTDDIMEMPVAVTPDLRWLALGCTNGQVRLVDLQAQTNCSFEAHARTVRGIGFSPDARKLVTVGEDQVLRVWELAGHRPVVSLPLPDALPERIFFVFVNFSADGKYLVANSGRTIILWDAVHWRQLKSDRYPGDITANRLSPDGQTLATAAFYDEQGGPHGFDLRDTTSWAKRPLFAGHGMVWDFDWSPDGRRLVTLAANESILWDTTSWQELASFNFQAMIMFALFSPDGNKLALTDNTGTLHVWRAPSLAQIEAQEAKRGRWP